MEKSLRNETILTIFLTSCLYKFVLSNKKVDYVYARASKIASLMARGEKFSVPILVSIYHVLREIFSSPNVSVKNIIFSYIMYMAGLGSIKDPSLC